MTLVLQIENYEILSDGSPAQFSVGARGCQVGRNNAMDWVLPDPSRHISGHHFNISVKDGAYWIEDVSANGTFLQGSRYRLDQPHRINHMDRFQVGQYFILCNLQQAGVSPVRQAPAQTDWQTGASPGPSAPVSNDDPWDLGGTASPINVDPVRAQPRRPDFGDDFITNPLRSPDPAPAPAPPPRAEAPPAPTPEGDSPFEPQAPLPDPAPPPAGIQMPAHLTTPPSPMPPTPRQDQSAMPGPSEPLAAAPRPDAASVQRPEAAPAPAPATGTGTGDFVKQFCEGAGLAPDAYGDVDPGVLARALGVSMRSVAVELMSLLQARDAAKQFTRGGERTMRRSTDNNPLKFLPDAEQAIEAMYLKHRAGFLNGPDGLSEALRDIRLHQNAVFAAIQPALAQLLSDLAPETIEEGVQGGMLGGGKKSKAWETFVARWDAKAHRHDNGMLDEFLVYFAKAYADVVASGKF